MEKEKPAAHTPNPLGEWHDLREHLESVAEKAKEYAAKFGAGDLGYYAGLWHDLGKYHPKFQAYLEQCHAASEAGDNKPLTSVTHAIYGARLASEVLQPLAPIIYGHHSGLPEIQSMKDKLLAPELDESYQAVMHQASQHVSQLQSTTDLKKLMASLPNNVHSYELLIRLLFSCLVDADYLDTEAHFDSKAAKQRGSSIQVAQLWATLQEKQEKLLREAENTLVNQVRAEVYCACVEAAKLSPGVFRLVVPTGGGKTLSGLAFALHHAVQHSLERVIFSVPYTSIIEQTVEVYRSIFGDEAVLEHHSAAKSDFGNQEDQENAQRLKAQARLATQNWDAPLVVTTTVQLFESLFVNRPSRCRKLHNIVGSVIVLDEVQTLPVSVLNPILSVLRELAERYRVTIVLCTATQPALEAHSPYLQGFEAGSVRDIVSYEQARQYFSALSRVNYEIIPHPWSWKQLVLDVREHNHNQALIVLNTRKDALRVLDELQSETSFQSSKTPQIAVQETLAHSKVFHLSTLLCGAHRRQVLDALRNCLKNGRPCLLVSTQVVEAGVDLDFPAVYRALGPLDRIVQAAGRCNREGRMQGKGRVVIFKPEDGSVPPAGEYKKAVDKTALLLQGEDLELDNPDIFEEYFRSLYQIMEPDKYSIQFLRASFNYPKVAENFKLIADDTTPVVIQYNDRVRSLLHQIERRGLLSSDHRELQPYLVNLYNREFSKAKGVREEITPGLWVWRGSYDPVRGIGIGDQAISYDPADLIQ